MSRVALMVLWLITVMAHASIILYVPPVAMQLLVLGVFEGILGALALRVRFSIEQQTIQRVIDLADAEERTTVSSSSSQRHV